MADDRQTGMTIPPGMIDRTGATRPLAVGDEVWLVDGRRARIVAIQETVHETYTEMHCEVTLPLDGEA